MAARPFTTEEFDRIIVEEKKLTVIDFWAPWCVYCRRIEPAYEKVGSEYAEQLIVGKVNIDDEPQLAERYQVEVIPTLIVFKEGEPAARIVAPDSKAKIESFIEENLNRVSD